MNENRGGRGRREDEKGRRGEGKKDEAKRERERDEGGIGKTETQTGRRWGRRGWVWSYRLAGRNFYEGPIYEPRALVEENAWNF